MIETSPPAALLLHPIAGSRTVSIALWLNRGSAHESAELAGATHLVEHLTLRRCGELDRYQLSALVDRLGGEVDAWTSSEGMGLSIHTTIDALPEALGLMRDAMLRPSFASEDVELERRVALAELEMVADDPVEQVEEAILTAAWGSHPLARPVIGSEESLKRLRVAELRAHHAEMVVPGRILMGLAGDVAGADLGSLLHGLPLEQPPRQLALPPLHWAADHRILTRVGLDQVHVRLALPAIRAGDPEVVVLGVLNRILGVGASSRLFQRLREEEGLTYDIWSALVLRGLGGLLEVGWVCAPAVLDELYGLVHEELRALARGGVSRDEVDVAKESLSRGLVMDAESPSGLCGLEMAEMLERERRFDLDRSLAEIAAVGAEDVNRMAVRVLDLKQLASAVCGPEGVGLRAAS